MQKKHGFTALGPADGPVKTAILGRNAAPLYGIEVTEELAADLAGDRFAELRSTYIEDGAKRSNLAYGFVSKRG